jgi:hypothetical protein
MKNNYKILVLSDLKDTTDNILKSTVSLAKIIKADIEFFYVKKPTDVVDTESQLSAMRVINQEHIDIDKQIAAILNPINKDYGLNIKSNFTLGNVKNEIEKRIKSSKSDIIVLGKRKPNAIKFVGDNITDYVLKQHQGTILIAGNKNVLEPGYDLSLGVFNSEKESFNMAFSKDLVSHTKQPLKAFRIIENKTVSESNNTLKDNDTVEFVFEKNDNTIKNLSNYLLKNNVNLFCLNRGVHSAKKASKALKPEVKEVINKLNISMLLTNEEI